MRARLLAGFAAVLLATLGYVWWSSPGLGRAPTVQLTLLDGEKLTLQSLRGRPVMITFWATTCAGCRKEIPHLLELYRQFRPQGFELVAVAMSYDPPAQVYDFSRRKKLPYRVALDMDDTAAQAFGGVRLTPTTFVIARDGRVVYQKIGAFEPPGMKALIEKLISEKP